MALFGHKARMVDEGDALSGRDEPMPVPTTHAVNGHRLAPPYPEGFETVVLGMGCFWGAEKMFWNTEGVWVTAVGYAGGFTPHPTYEEVCSGRTGHAEVVRVVFDPAQVGFGEVLRVFWEGHDPTQGMRQGNDAGTQYRSLLAWTSDAQHSAVDESRDMYQRELTAAGFGTITTELIACPEFYFAEGYHQQYLAKNPAGYCGHGGTGVSCPIGLDSPG